MRIYQYIGAIANSEEKPLLQQVFYRYLNAQGKRKMWKLYEEKKINRLARRSLRRKHCYILAGIWLETNKSFIAESFSEVISSLPYSRMQFYYPSLGALPKSFGWLTETGILYAQVLARRYYILDRSEWRMQDGISRFRWTRNRTWKRTQITCCWINKCWRVRRRVWAATYRRLPRRRCPSCWRNFTRCCFTRIT